MSLRDYLRLEGGLAIALGVVLVLEAAVLGDWDEPGWVAPVVAVVTVVLGAAFARFATRSAVRKAAQRPPRMAAGAVRRQTVLETVGWALAVGVWVAATGDSAELVAGTGAGTVAFGIVRAFERPAQQLRVDRRRYVLGADVTAG